MLQSAMRLVAKPLCNVRLAVEAQPVIAAFREKMQMTADGPEKTLALLEDRQLFAGESPFLREFIGGICCKRVLGDPEQRVEIT